MKLNIFKLFRYFIKIKLIIIFLCVCLIYNTKMESDNFNTNLERFLGIIIWILLYEYLVIKKAWRTLCIFINNLKIIKQSIFKIIINKMSKTSILFIICLYFSVKWSTVLTTYVQSPTTYKKFYKNTRFSFHLILKIELLDNASWKRLLSIKL